MTLYLLSHLELKIPVRYITIKNREPFLSLKRLVQKSAGFDFISELFLAGGFWCSEPSLGREEGSYHFSLQSNSLTECNQNPSPSLPPPHMRGFLPTGSSTKPLTYVHLPQRGRTPLGVDLERPFCVGSTRHGRPPAALRRGGRRRERGGGGKRDSPHSEGGAFAEGQVAGAWADEIKKINNKTPGRKHVEVLEGLRGIRIALCRCVRGFEL